ncbi:hypothetical protein NU09_2066 [Flavobacterium beibuense]|uniref:Uncharacterized protein n=1 Tax=Flavobacterium beibuense TaxID=657326 RepID=A0A444WAX4_9FLAO|nr:hypothetical protein NU09_2066 [Flavobacterium beibuense]
MNKYLLILFIINNHTIANTEVTLKSFTKKYCEVMYLYLNHYRYWD